MSSILRALKKLEHDPRHLEDNRPLDTKFVPLADTVTHKPYATLLLTTIGGGIICGLVFLAGWWVFSGKTETPPVPPQEVTQQVSMPQQSAPGPAAPVKILQHQAISAEMAINTGPETTSPTIGKNSSFNSGLETTSPTTIGKNSREKISLPAQNNFPPAAMQRAAIQPEKVEIPQLNGPDMKLQAITWSRESHKRIAVISNRILHEGETVSGYLLVTINQDDVVLTRDGRTWKLSFRTK